MQKADTWTQMYTTFTQYIYTFTKTHTHTHRHLYIVGAGHNGEACD